MLNPGVDRSPRLDMRTACRYPSHSRRRPLSPPLTQKTLPHLPSPRGRGGTLCLLERTLILPGEGQKCPSHPRRGRRIAPGEEDAVRV
jgi:hypothetical protein